MERQLKAVALAAVFAASLLPFVSAPVRADDFGPHGDIRELRFVAQRLLAHRLRTSAIDPKTVVISDVVAVGNQALLSWTAGSQHAIMGLVRMYDRWWDALDASRQNPSSACWWWSAFFPLSPQMYERGGFAPDRNRLERILGPGLANAAANHNVDVMAGDNSSPQPSTADKKVFFRPSCEAEYYDPNFLRPGGGRLYSMRYETANYDVTIAYPRNVVRDLTHVQFYGRSPTAAEILPYPTIYHFISTAVAYFDLTIESDSPVTFSPGTTIDVWFPFVLDDKLRYDLTLSLATEPIGPIYATPYDNVLSYKLPGFTTVPGKTLMAEIDGNWH